MNIRALTGDTTTRASSIAPKASTPSSTGSNNSDSNNLMGGIGKSDFLQLLVAQLRNQDPLQPMQDGEFIAQMAQLNTVEQLTTMNNNLTEFMNFNEMAQASSLIGKTIEAEPQGKAPIQGTVQQVVLEQGKPVLMVDGQKVAMSDIRQISATS